MKKKVRSGLTLLEIMVALVILSLVMLGMANLFVAVKRHVHHTRARIGGAEMGKYFLDPLQRDVRAIDWNLGTNNLTVGTYAPAAVPVADMTYSISCPVVNMSAGEEDTLRKVKANFTWDERAPGGT